MSVFFALPRTLTLHNSTLIFGARGCKAARRRALDERFFRKHRTAKNMASIHAGQLDCGSNGLVFPHVPAQRMLRDSRAAVLIFIFGRLIYIYTCVFVCTLRARAVFVLMA